MAKKHVDNIDMSFLAEEKKPEPIAKATEVFEKEGKVIYKKDETGFIQFYDGNGQVIEDGVIERLSDAYQPAPYINDRGDEQDGGLRIRHIKQQTIMGRVKNTEVSFEDCDIIEERQYYKNGEAVIRTIPKNHYHVVKYLRGGYDEDAKEVSALDKIKENKDEGKLFPVENQENEEEG